MASNGTAQQQVTATSSSGENFPSWSPTGQRIVYERDSEIYSVRLDGSGLKRLTNNSVEDTTPEWSPTGTLIAFSHKGANKIFVMRSDGSKIRRVTEPDSASAYVGSWSPNGKRILFSSNGYGSTTGYNLYSIKPDGTGRQPLASGPGDQEYGSWSPDGSSLVYADNSGGDWEIVSQTVLGLTYAQLTDNGVTDWEPDWQAT